MFFGKVMAVSARRGSHGQFWGRTCTARGKRCMIGESGTDCPHLHWKVPEELDCPSLLPSWRLYHRLFQWEQQKARLCCSSAEVSAPAPKDEGVKTWQGNGSWKCFYNVLTFQVLNSNRVIFCLVFLQKPCEALILCCEGLRPLEHSIVEKL